MLYDLIIIGGGPGGVAAGIYAARKKMKTLVIAKEFGGQSLVSPDIQNWIGTKSISGLELAKNLEEHLRAQPDIEILAGDIVKKVEKAGNNFKLETEGGKSFEAKTVLVTSGSRHRRLGIPGEDRLDGKGVAWCATCDAPLFSGKDVAIIGAGNSALEAVRDLSEYANKLYLLVRSEKIKGDPITYEKIKNNPKVEIISMSEAQEILGDNFVSGLKYLDKKSGEAKQLEVGGVFVEIGAVPNVEFLGDLVEKNKFNEITVNCETQETSRPGIWAAGDASSVRYKQNNISAGDAVKAVLGIYDYLHRNNK
jgi:NADH-dependent peroxiredoxin subunit F